MTHSEDGEPCRSKKPMSRLPDPVTSAEECCNECWAVEGCLGFDYESGSRTCVLSFCLSQKKVWRAMHIGGLKFQHYDHRKMQRLWNPTRDPMNDNDEPAYVPNAESGPMRPKGARYKGFKPAKPPPPGTFIDTRKSDVVGTRQELQSLLGAEAGPP